MKRTQRRYLSSIWTLLGSLAVTAIVLPQGSVHGFDGPAPDATLRLINGDFVSGRVVASDDPAVLNWQCRYFSKPLQFSIDRVLHVGYPEPTALPATVGEYGLELAEDDALFGSLIGLHEDEAEIDVARFGRLHVRRDSICRLYRRNSEDLIYSGPNGLAGWQQSTLTSPWRDDSGMPFTDQPDAFLYGDFKIPDMASIEFELSWKSKPDFVFALDVDERSATIQRAFRFEVWDSDLVVHRETENEADVVSVQEIASGAGRAHLHAFLDRQNGRLIVCSPTGGKLADLHIAKRKAEATTGLWLVNKRGDIRLERLRITRWIGTLPQEVQPSQARVHRTDGSLMGGQLVAFDSATRMFTVRDAQGETNVPADQIESVLMSPVTKASPRSFRVVYQDGTKLSGKLTEIGDRHLTLSCPSIREPLQVDMTELRSFMVLPNQASPPPVSIPKGRPGMLQLDGVQLRGLLVDGVERPDSSCLVWHPEQGRVASPLCPGLSGRIVYHEVMRPPTSNTVRTQTRAVQAVQQRAVVRDGMVRIVGNEPIAMTSTRGTRSLHLRSGDMFPCDVDRIDEKGVTFRTPLLATTFVTHDKIKAIELSNVQSALKMNKVKRERLLTLPRMQKGSPPTQLICSANGDFLRGRVLDMDDTILRVEVRLETRELPRDRVSQIIWLHPDELDGAQPPAEEADPDSRPPATRVLALRSDGIRLTFLGQRLTEQVLSGTSEVLGECQADLTQVDQLVFGNAIEQAAAQLQYHQWKLHYATDPKFVQSADGDAATDRIPGTESTLVGKPAPDFELRLFGGGSFRLADSKGKIVVLDFWASWCGPCLQAMPQVEKVVREFDGQVQLVAVNIEEQEQQVSSALDRHKLEVTAALDRDGLVAAKYAVTAIPQTVVIDKSGKIARLFVGGGPNLGAQLRDALQGLINAD